MPTNTLGAILKRIKESEALVITPVIDRWLVQHPEGITCPPEMMPLVERLLSSPNSDRSARFGASGRGSCLRKQVFDFIGMPPLLTHDSVLQNLFNDGTWRHIRWQLMGLLAGVFANDAWDVPAGKFGDPMEAPVEVVHTLPEYHTKVSCDGENSIEGYGFELKGHGWYGNVVANGVPPKHLFQVHTYFIATGYDRFIYVAEDKRSNDWKEIVVRPDKAILQQTKDELNALSDAVEDQQLPAILTACRGEKGEDYKGCPYRGTERCLAQHQWPASRAWGS